MKDFGNCKTCLLETGDGQYIQNKGDLTRHEVNLQSKFASEPVFVYIDQPRHLRTGFRNRLTRKDGWKGDALGGHLLLLDRGGGET